MSGEDKKLPALEDWHAPWELDADKKIIEDEEAQVVDKGRLKKYLYGLLKDKEKLQSSVSTLTTERDEAREKIAEKEREGESEVDRLKRENAELKANPPKASIDDDPEVLRLKAALEVGLSAKHVGRLNRDLKTFDELVEDAKELQASFGGHSTTEGEGEEETPRARPRRASTSVDPAQRSGGGKEVTLEEMVDRVPLAGSFSTSR